jgi:HD-like signal output (HDOD) protein
MRALDQILAEIGRGEVVFPTHADVAVRVRLALDDPELHVAKAAQLIQAEPLLASRVVALANSVAFNRGGGQIAGVRIAVSRLGLRFVRALATAVVMRQMAVSIQSPRFRSLASRLWEHSVHVAALARLLAGRFLPSVADIALFAGIIHEVSGFYLIAQSDVRPDLFTDGTLLMGDAEAPVGHAVMAALAVPEDVVAGVAALWWPGEIVFPPATLGDLLRLADRLTPMASPLERPEDKAASELSDAVAAQLGEILDQSGDELDALTSVLRY